MKKIKIKYGSMHSQYGELYLPNGQTLGTVCLFHGGFWSMPYDLNQFDEICMALGNMGFSVWNIEYRRIGDPEYNWKSIFEDSVAAVAYLSEIKNQYPDLNLDNIYVIGHSAGGHLSIWLNTQQLHLQIRKYIGLAPILDLRRAYAEGIGNGVTDRLLMDTPDEGMEKYQFASPIENNIKNGKEVIIHGELDDYVPCAWSEDYYKKMMGFNNEIEFIKIEKCGHMEFLEVDSDALKKILEQLIGSD